MTSCRTLMPVGARVLTVELTGRGGQADVPVRHLRFASGSIDEAGLRDQLDAIASTRRDLRYVHLAAHLQTPKLLTQDQIAAYNRLRGYDSGDPCLVVPPGHDPKMWRLHNGCDG